MYDWKEGLRSALRTAAQLADAGWIPHDSVKAYEPVLARYPLLLTSYYASLIDPTDPHCPIRRQAIPELSELTLHEGKADPLEDLKHQPAPRITHRYPSRVLLHLTPLCSMNCRYCFRKTLLGEGRTEFFEGEITSALEYLQKTQSISEVIFSGGDPFLANENTLESVLTHLGQMPHIRRVRFHSRVPVTLPSRVTPVFAKLLTVSGRTTTVVTHFNHPRELTPLALEALDHLHHAELRLLNQSVLLRGVNDRSDTLAQLSEALFEGGVLPYYLHHPDPAQGTNHFALSWETGLKIYHRLRAQLPGYLVPRYVVDDPKFAFKQDVEVLKLAHSIEHPVPQTL